MIGTARLSALTLTITIKILYFEGVSYGKKFFRSASRRGFGGLVDWDGELVGADIDDNN